MYQREWKHIERILGSKDFMDMNDVQLLNIKGIGKKRFLLIRGHYPFQNGKDLRNRQSPNETESMKRAIGHDD